MTLRRKYPAIMKECCKPDEVATFADISAASRAGGPTGRVHALKRIKDRRRVSE